jgi:copper chaperone CopZ
VIKKESVRRLNAANKIDGEDNPETGPKKPCTGCVRNVDRHLRHVDGKGNVSTVKSKICSMADTYCANSKTKVHFMTPQEATMLDQKRRML